MEDRHTSTRVLQKDSSHWPCHSMNSFLPDSAFASVHRYLRCQEKGSSVNAVTKDPQATLSLAGWTVPKEAVTSPGKVVPQAGMIIS